MNDLQEQEDRMQIEGLKIDLIGGNCPVQAEGTLDGVPFYFRARGQHWSFSVGAEPVGNPDWTYREPYGDEPSEAGWMSEDEARAFIAKAATLYREEKPRMDNSERGPK